MASTVISVPDLVRGLILLQGESQQQVAVRAGISPGAVAALSTRSPKPLLTWLQFVGALRITVEIAWRDRRFQLALPRAAKPSIERAWRAWRSRRLASIANHLRQGDREATRSAIDARAADYIAHEQGRLEQHLAALPQRLDAVDGRWSAPGLRTALHSIVGRLALTAEELSLWSGTSLSACQLAMDDGGDGRLVTFHRLLSAIDARMTLLLPGGGAIAVAPCPPGDWQPGAAVLDHDEVFDEKPLARLRVQPPEQNRSSMTSEAMLALYDQGCSLGEIARRAGVSRQRVHQLARENGRRGRRDLARDERIRQGRDSLGIDG